MSWTDTRIEILTKLWSEGLTAAQIAMALGGVTRNAVIGKVHRLNLRGRPVPQRAVRRRASESRARGHMHRPPQSALQPFLPAVGAPPLAPAPDHPPGVLDVTHAQCRWPEGDPKREGFHFCGRPKQGEGPYCPHHHARACQPRRHPGSKLRVSS